MVSLDGGRTIFSYIPILQQIALPLFLYLKQGISLPLYLVVQPNCGLIPIKILNISDQEHVLQKNTVAAQLEPIEIDIIEECHNINAVNCNV
jgi:hypothetical protein